MGLVERLLADPPEARGGDLSAFCDFAAGGDENVLAVRRGNKVDLVACWREKDTMRAVGQFIRHFREQKLEPHRIAGDESGLGGPVCDRLREVGWPIKRVNNGSPAKDPEHYANLAAEMWFAARTKVERREIILPNDRELIAQLTSRRGWPDSKGRLVLEPKSDLRSRNLPSPDRADAVLGTLPGALVGGAFNSATVAEIRKANPHLFPQPFDRRAPLRITPDGMHRMNPLQPRRFTPRQWH